MSDPAKDEREADSCSIQTELFACALQVWSIWAEADIRCRRTIGDDFRDEAIVAIKKLVRAATDCWDDKYSLFREDDSDKSA